MLSDSLNKTFPSFRTDFIGDDSHCVTRLVIRVGFEKHQQIEHRASIINHLRENVVAVMHYFIVCLTVKCGVCQSIETAFKPDQTRI